MSSSLTDDQIVGQIIQRVYQFVRELRADNSNLNAGDSSSSTALRQMTGLFEDGLSSSSNNNNNANEIVAGSPIAAQDALTRRIVNSTATRDFVPFAPNARLSLPNHEANLQMFALGAVKIAKPEPSKVQAAWTSAAKAKSSTAVTGLDGLYKNICLSSPSLWPVLLPDVKGQPNILPFPFSSSTSKTSNEIGKGLFLRSDDAFNQLVAPALAASSNISVSDVHRALCPNNSSAAVARSILERTAWDISVDSSKTDSTQVITTAETVKQNLNSFKQVLESATTSSPVAPVDVVAAALAAEASIRRFLSTPDGINVRPIEEVRAVVAEFIESSCGVFENFSLASSLIPANAPSSADAVATAVAPLVWILHVRAHQNAIAVEEKKKAEETTAAAASTATTTTTTPSTTTTANETEESSSSSKKKKKLKKKEIPERPWRLPLRLLPGFKCKIYIEEGLPHTAVNAEAFIVGPSIVSKVTQIPKQSAPVESSLILTGTGAGDDAYIFGKGDAVRIKFELTPPAPGLAASLTANDVALSCAKFFLTSTELLTLSHPTTCNIVPPSKQDETKATEEGAGAAAATAVATTEEKKEENTDAANGDVDASAAVPKAKTPISALRADPLFSLGLNKNSTSASSSLADLESETNKSKITMFYMRAQCPQTWRPLLLKFLAVVLHSGAPLTESTIQFVAQRWVPDWMQLLQGEVNQPGRDRLHVLLDFILTKVQQNKSGSVLASSIVSHLKSIFFEQDHWQIDEIVAELESRSKFAFATGAALANLKELVVKTTNSGEATSKPLGRAVSLTLLRWVAKENQQHYILNAFGGCQSEAAEQIRSGVFSLLDAVFTASQQTSASSANDLNPALLALASTPSFDRDDAKSLSENASKTCKFLAETVEKSGAASAANYKKSDLGAACRLTQLVPAAQPEMNTNALGVTIGSSSIGISINRTSMGALCLRSSCSWPVGGETLTQCPDGVRYCEFTFGQTKGNILRAMIGICDANTKFHDFDNNKSEIEGGTVGQMSLDTKVHDSRGKIAIPFGYENDVVGVGVDLRASEVFYTLNGAFMFKTAIPVPVDHSAQGAEETVGGARASSTGGKPAAPKPPVKTLRKDYHPFLLYETRDRTNVSANFGQAPFAFDIVQYRVATLPDEVFAGFEGDVATRCLLHSSVAGLVSGNAKMNASLTAAAGRALGVLTNAAGDSLSALRVAMIAAQIFVRVLAVTSCVAAAETDEFKNLRSTALSSLRMLCKNQTVSESIRSIAWRSLETILTQAPDLVDSSQISKSLLENLKISLETGNTATSSPPSSSSSFNDYLPSWTETDETVAVMNGPRVTVDPRLDEHMDEDDDDQQMAGVPAIAVGSVLPDGADVVSFRVFFHRPPLTTASGQSSRMASGGCFIGVTSQTLSSIQSLHDWKTVNPPVVWAMHDEATFQLPHADIATVMTDSITFMAGSTVSVTVRRSAGTVSFSRGATETVLFRHVDPAVQLRPFVLLVGKDSYAHILPGSMTQIVSPQKALNGALNRTLFEVLRRVKKDSTKKELYDSLIASVTEMVGADIKSSKWNENERALTLLGVLPRSSCASIVVPSGQDSTALVSGEIISVHNNLSIFAVKNDSASSSSNVSAELQDGSATSCFNNKFEISGLVEQRQLNAVRSSLGSLLSMIGTSSTSTENETDETDQQQQDVSDAAILNHICKPIAADIAKSVINWCSSLQIASLVREQELRLRDAIILEEAQSREAIVSTQRARKVDAVLERSISAAMPLLQPPVRPASFTFHPHRCSAHVEIPDHYRNALMLCPPTVHDRGPHVAIAREAIDNHGISSFRLKVMAEWSSLMPSFLPYARFTPGCYVGLCLENYNGTPRYLPAEDPPSVWALSFFDTPKLHLKHSCAFPTSLPLVRNGDTLRFVIDREKGTMEAFRTPQVGSRERGIEQSIGLIYDNIPKDVMLFPFIQLMSPRNASLFLPLNESLPRATTTCTRVAPLVGNAARSVSGSSDLRCIVCLSRFIDNPLTPPAWFHCVQCADIDLCQSCFNAHAHCGHEFVQMRRTGFLENRGESTDPAIIPAVNSEIELSPVAAHLRRSENCIPVEGSFETAVRSLRGKTDFSAAWTLLRRPQAQATFEISVDFDSAADLPQNGQIYVGLIRNSCLEGVASEQLHGYLAKTALDPVQRDGIVLASDASLFVWPEHSLGQSSSAGVFGSVLDFGVYLSFFLEHDGTVQVQTNGSQLFKLRRDLWQNEKFSIVVSVKNIDHDTPVAVNLHSGFDTVPMIGRVMERIKDLGALRVAVGGQARVTLPGSSARESYVAVKSRGQLRIGEKAIHVDSCIDKATPVIICALSATSEGCTVHDGFKEIEVDQRCLLIPASNALREDDQGDDNDLFPFPEERTRLVNFYKLYVPERSIEDVEKAIMAYSKHKGGFTQMWKDLTAKYGPEPQQSRPRLQPPATRDLLVNSAELLRVVASLRLLSAGDNMLAMLPAETQNSLQKSVLGALRVLSREQDSSSSSTSSSAQQDAVHLLTLAVRHAPTLHIATDRSLKQDSSAATATTRIAQIDSSSEWFKNYSEAEIQNQLPLDLSVDDSHMKKALGNNNGSSDDAKWTGSLFIDTGLYTVFSVDFKNQKATITVSVGATATFEITDIVRSRNTRSIQFLLVTPAGATSSPDDNKSSTIATRLNNLTLVYDPLARRLLCPQKDSKGNSVTMMCTLAIGADGHLVGQAVLRGGAEGTIDIRVQQASKSSVKSSSTSSTGGALPPIDLDDPFEDLDDASTSSSDSNNKKKSSSSSSSSSSDVDSRVSRLALSATISELTNMVRAFVKSNSSNLLLSAGELFQLLITARGTSEAQQLLTLSGFALSEQRIAELVEVASKSVFEIATANNNNKNNSTSSYSSSSSSSSSSDVSSKLDRVSRAVAAARVIRFAATTAGAFSAKINNVKDQTFWNALLTALRALHVAVVATSATRECVSTVRIFALAAFRENKPLSQFLFGPIIYFARKQYEHGSALGHILGSTRALVDLIASLVSQANENKAVTELVRNQGMSKLSSIDLPVEQLAFLADAARSVATRSTWPSVAALLSTSDTVDSNTVKQNGDGVAWNLIEARKTKMDLENQAGNRFGAKEQASRLEGVDLFCGTVLSNMIPFDQWGKDTGANRSTYYECTIPPTSVRVAIGWTTKTAAELAGLRRTQLIREIHSPDTIIFDGAAIYNNGSYTQYGWAGTSQFDVCGASVAFSPEKNKVVLRWSINGEFFPEIDLPEKMKGKPLRAFAQISRSDTGMRLAASAAQCRFTPLGFSNLMKSEQAAADYDSQKRLPAASGEEKQPGTDDFEAAAKELGKFLEEAEKAANPVVPSSPGKGDENALTVASPQNLSATIKHAHEILVIQRCLSRCVDAMDLEGNVSANNNNNHHKTNGNDDENNNNNNSTSLTSSSSSQQNVSTISILKRIVTPSYRRNVLAILQPLTSRESSRHELPPCAVRWYLLFSHQNRTPADALHHSILAQLKRQLAPSQLLHQPMFLTSLQMTDNGHTPIDAGGPYNQVWSLLGEELSCEGDVPRTTVPGFESGSSSLRFFANPLFRTVNSARGKVLVPDANRQTPNDLAHFKFLGQLFGHLARAKTPLPIDVSVIIWMHLVTDKITIEDYYAHVESSWRGTIEDEDFLSMGESKADPYAAGLLEYFPNFFEELAKLKHLSSSSGASAVFSVAALRKKAAENCVLNSIIPQMDALRSGLWEILGRRTVCAMTASDLELAVCGDPNPSMDQLLASVQCNLDTHEAAIFWAALKQLTPSEWSDFFFFCAAQRRFPLNKKISVVPLSGSTDKHMPMASTCFNLLKMPPYKSDVQCLEKLRQAIAVKVMELA